MAIKWQGMEKLVATISNAHPKAVEQSLKVLKNNGDKVKAIAMENAPEETGILKKNITTSYPGMEAHIHAEAGYSGYVEYGTRFNDGGQPFMRPAIEQIQPQFQKDMTDVMKGAFK
ncbi:TPA: hypothetical protein T7L01_000157 [Streptococcus suis]|nr:hypothetical protein [Streptococcus suis]